MVNFSPEEYQQRVGCEVDLSGEQERCVVEEWPLWRVGNVDKPLVWKDEEERPASEETHHVE